MERGPGEGGGEGPREGGGEGGGEGPQQEMECCNILGRFIGRTSCVFASQPCLPRGNSKPHILLLGVISSHFPTTFGSCYARSSPRWSIKALASPRKKTSSSEGLQPLRPLGFQEKAAGRSP